VTHSSAKVTARTTIKRVPERSVPDRAALNAVLDSGLVAHVAVVEDGQPFVVPVGYARMNDEIVFHGSSASRLFKRLAEGQPTCVTVTLLDGLVLARSSFESSMNYRSAMMLGTARKLSGDAELSALRAISDHLLPDRWSDIRPPAPQERKATMVLSLPLDEWSVKIRTGGPEDLDEDLNHPVYSHVWAGVVPIVESFAAPQPDERSVDRDIPDYIGRWSRA
jgi:nitroimidazol reductase NimA-like FMN-containing flavoprotein (pyridoxamine 5'-phosphate oxidase superfamily)